MRVLEPSHMCIKKTILSNIRNMLSLNNPLGTFNKEEHILSFILKPHIFSNQSLGQRNI